VNVFFSDRDLGKQFPDILKKAGMIVERHSDHFADDAKDEEWLAEVGKRGWYVLTHDRRIRYKPNEIGAVEKFGIGLFTIVGKAPFAELAQNFVFTLPKIIKFIDKNPRPFIAKVYRPDKTRKKAKSQPSGYVKMWVSF
jgi:predicted nuclease of predicted toxin-antitoxin system